MQEIDQFLRLREVSRLTGLSRSSIYRMEARGQFPNRVKISERASAYKASEVTRWMTDRPRATKRVEASVERQP